MKSALPLALLILHLAVRSAAEAPSLQPIQCAAKVAAVSSCLPHVAALPKNATLTPSAACCQAFVAAIDDAGGGAGCLCDLIRRPFLHGSRLDASRLVSLLSSCGKSISVEPSSFAEICQDSIAKTETQFEPLSSSSTAAEDDYEADAGSAGPDRRGGGGRRPKPPRPSPTPPRSNPRPSPPRAEPKPPPSPEGPPPPPTPPSPPPAAACPPTILVIEGIPDDSADGRREMFFRGAVVFLLSIFALC